MTNKKSSPVRNSQILLYQTKDGQAKIEVKMENETVWLTKKQMAELFNVKKQDIDYHTQNVYITGELEQSSTTKNYLVVQKELKEYLQNQRLEQGGAKQIEN